MIRSSESIAALAAALVDAQAEMPEVPKGAVGQVGTARRKYSDIADVIETVRPVLHAHGLSYVQFPGTDDRGVTTVTTRLVHKSGEWMEGTVSMPSGGNGAQGVGSAITYARRYSLVAMLGLASEDDDGAGASAPPPRQQAQRAPRQEQQPEPPANPNALTPAQLKKLQVLANEKGYGEKGKRLALWTEVLGREGITSANDLNKTEAARLIDAMEKMPNG